MQKGEGRGGSSRGDTNGDGASGASAARHGGVGRANHCVKTLVKEYLEKRLWTEHGGRLTQGAASSMAKKDRTLQMRTEKLAIRASDVYWPWSWVSERITLGLTSGKAWRLTLQTLGSLTSMGAACTRDDEVVCGSQEDDKEEHYEKGSAASDGDGERSQSTVLTLKSYATV